MTDFIGAFGYQNWHAFIRGEPELEANEIALHSDSRFTGELSAGLGPYHIINTVPYGEPGALRVSLVLRSGWHVGYEHEPVQQLMAAGKGDTSRFHGGSPYDEIAALLSLAHGVRLHAGGIIRTFYPTENPRGRPEADNSPPVVLPTGRRLTVLPFVSRTTALDVGVLSSYPKLKWRTASHILRAARSYQQAIWIADSDPNLAWLMLVSAIETAAVEWHRLSKVPADDPVTLLRNTHSEFATLLAGAAGEYESQVMEIVASQLADTLRSRQKFTSFLTTFCPAAPSPRAPEAYQVDWESENLTAVFNTVYGYRSKALHESHPFPPPMCEGPMIGDVSDTGIVTVYAERPTATTFTHGGFWTRDQLPMHLHTFEYIVRHSLVSFWGWAATQPRALVAVT